MNNDEVMKAAPGGYRVPPVHDRFDHLHDELARLQDAVELLKRRPVPMPWECPRCERMNAPHALQCGCNKYGKHPI